MRVRSTISLHTLTHDPSPGGHDARNTYKYQHTETHTLSVASKHNYIPLLLERLPIPSLLSHEQAPRVTDVQKGQEGTAS